MLRAEYRYSDFGTWSNSLLMVSPGVSTVTVATNLKINTQVGMIGIAYRFGGPSLQNTEFSKFSILARGRVAASHRRSAGFGAICYLAQTPSRRGRVIGPNARSDPSTLSGGGEIMEQILTYRERASA